MLLSNMYPDLSRSFISNQIKSGNVLLNSAITKPSQAVKNGDDISVNFQIDNAGLPQAEEIPLNIIFENEDVIVIDKQPNLVVHPAHGNTSGTLVNALMKYFPNINEAVYDKNSNLSLNRPGIVHRLDKDTSGVMIVAKTQKALISLSKQIKNRTVNKKYLALCYGWPKQEFGTLTNYIGRDPKNRQKMAEVGDIKGKIAISVYKVIEYYTIGTEKLSLIEFDIKTGRTHQIRYHAQILGNPIIGDKVYNNKLSIKLSKKLNANRPLLHSCSLSINLPGDPKPTSFQSKLPDDFSSILSKLQKQS